MFVDLYLDLFVDLYLDLFVDLYLDLFVDLYLDLFVDLSNSFYFCLYKREIQFNSIQFKVLFKVDTYSIHITQL